MRTRRKRAVGPNRSDGISTLTIVAFFCILFGFIVVLAMLSKPNSDSSTPKKHYVKSLPKESKPRPDSSTVLQNKINTKSMKQK